jgi:hypothetical protein
MKKTTFTLGLLVLIALFSLNKVNGQWATIGTNIYNTNSGSVGIGNNAPASLLYVAKNMTEPTITVRNLGGSGGATYTMMDNASGANWKFKATSTGGFKIRDHANLMDVITIEPNSAANSIYIKTGGNIGMGTNSPSAKLQIYNNDRALIVDGAGAISTTPFQGLGLQYYWWDGQSAIQASYPGGYGYLTFYTTYGTTTERMRITYDGNVGIGTIGPSARLHVENPAGITETASIINNLEDADNAHGLYVNTARTTAGANILNAAAGGISRLYVRSDGNVGIGNTTPSAKLEVTYNANSYFRLGQNSIQPNLIYHIEVVAEGDGQSALYAFRTRESQNDGTGYGITTSNSAIVSNNFWGDLYTFGTSGFSYNDYNRTGGVLGAEINGSYWGSLGYRNSGFSTYGGYFTSTGTGAGKSFSTAMTGIGMGAWGDLLGADIHGKVYGTYTEGENYAMFADGDVYNNKLDIHLQENGTETKTVLYTNTSTEVTVQTSGKAILSGGRANIQFDPAFAASISSEESLVITVTPIGESNGVYLSQVTKSGFAVVENSNGKSSVTVNYIAIGKRAGYEHPSLAAEVVSADYSAKVDRGLRPDADTQLDSEGLYYEGGKLVVGVHPSSQPNPNKPAELEGPVPAVSAPLPTIESIDPATMPNKGLAN